MEFESKYGYVGIYTEYEPFVVEGVNETGLSAGLFFFPQYGEYAPYKPEDSARTLCDMQFVSWVLSQFSSIDEVKQALGSVSLVTLNHKIGSVHWRITQPDGKMVVLEVVGGVPQFYDNELGVLTNSPGFPWHMTNLDNYVNLRPGAASDYELTAGVGLRAIGGGSGMIGLPGDFTPPSRFVRAAFFNATAPMWKTSWEAVQQAFHILNNFDIPIGIQFPKGQAPAGMMSATQFTAATDQKAMRFYYRTAYNSSIRCIDLKSVDFAKVKYQSHPLDDVKEEPVQMLKIG
jgi:choloylglycine hydrolase